jgi:hypothetical protein
MDVSKRWRYALPWWRLGLWMSVFFFGSAVQGTSTLLHAMYEDPGYTSSLTLVAAAIYWAVALICLKAAFAGVYASKKGIYVAGFFTTRRIAWKEISRFSLAPHGVPFPNLTGMVETRAGDVHPITGIGRPPPFSERAGRSISHELINALNERLRQEQQALGIAPVPAGA